jgi:N-acetylmuramoyl-L-alanine amidase
MIQFAYFLLKVIICSAVLFGYYWFFLRNKVFHAYNRFYLLAIVVLSLTLPLMKINIFHKAAEPKTNIIRMLQVVTVGDEYMDAVIIGPKKNSITTEQILPFAYMLVSFVLLIMMLQMLIHIASLLRKNKVMLIEDIHFVNTDNAKGTPFSFFKYIFWNQQIDMQSPAGTRIFKHEVAHIQERHSWDKMFINTILIAFWINPIFWLIRRELSLIHEFTADKKAVEAGDTAAFAAMILAATYPQQRIGITNNFFYSPIKRRLMMLTKNQNPKMNYISRLLVLPLAVIVFAAFTLKAKTISDPKSNNAITNKITSFLTNTNPSSAGTETTGQERNTVKAFFSTERKIRVVLDAGHGGNDAGGKGTDGTTEKDLALQLTKKIKALNTNPNIEIILTREDDIYQTPKEKSAFANEQIADLFISVHIDNALQKDVDNKSGMSVWIARDTFSNSIASKLFASAIIGRFEGNYGLDVPKSPMQRQTGIWVLQATKAPSVLIEAGFISNDRDRVYLKSDKGQEAFATNVLNALNDYATGKYTLNESEGNQSIKQAFAARIDVAKNDEKADASQRVVVSSSIGRLNTLPPYIIIDGKKSDRTAFSNLKPDALNSVTVLKGEDAVKKYGADASDGAVEITTKPAENDNDQNRQPKVPSEIFTKTQTEAEFPGGRQAYKEFLEKNLNANVPVAEGWKAGLYTVMLKFIVNAKGEISSVQTENYKGTKTSEECIRLMKTSPKWIPAMQNGHAVASYKKQPITFVVAEEKGENKQAFVDPVFRVGNFTKSAVAAEDFKKEDMLTATDGYTVAQVQVYFSGAGFPQVQMATISGNNLAPIKSLIAKCGAGTNVTFDNVRITGPKGLMGIEGKSYALK